jgi:hypothetical protein
MNIYHAWFDLRPGVSDVGFADAVAAYLDRLRADGAIEGWRLTRRKLGLGPERLPEFNLAIECETLGQLDDAFGRVAARTDPMEGLHHAVNSKVTNLFFALYRDFPDRVRQRGEERF